MTIRGEAAALSPANARFLASRRSWSANRPRAAATRGRAAGNSRSRIKIAAKNSRNIPAFPWSMPKIPFMSRLPPLSLEPFGGKRQQHGNPDISDDLHAAHIGGIEIESKRHDGHCFQTT